MNRGHRGRRPPINPAQSAHRLDRFERELLEFWLSWLPYGGAPDGDIMPEFGMTRPQMEIRAIALVSRHLKRKLAIEEHALLIRAGLAAGILVTSRDDSANRQGSAS